nr:hypothetical protein [uncultured Sphingomonas sp.]
MNLVRLFGLTIDSEVPLEGMIPAPDASPVDVVIRRGVVGATPDLVIAEAGSFKVTDGREIIVEAHGHVPDRNLRLFLIGSAMGLVLHQRGLLPLHANAVSLEGRAIAVAGRAGAGKSTLAAWFSRQGLKIVGDDVIALQPLADGVNASPGPPRVRLWKEALDRFGLEAEGLEPSYLDAAVEKWDVPLGSADLVDQELPLGAVYVIEDGPDILIEPMGGAAATSALFDHTYRGGYADRRAEWRASHWRAVAAVAASVPVFTLQRPRDLNRLEALGRAVLEHARGQVARTGGADRSAPPRRG